MNTPQMHWGNPARVHERGNIAAFRFGTEAAQYEYGAKWLRALLGAPWVDKRGHEERGLSMVDMAVLVRSRKQMSPVASALRAVGLNVVARGENSLLILPEAEALATAADYLAGQRTAPSRRGQSGPIISSVEEKDVNCAARTSGLAVTDEDATRGTAYLTDLKASADWEHPLCLVAVLEQYLKALGYHIAFDGESSLYPATSSGALNRNGRELGGELTWYNIARILNAAADFQRFCFPKPLSHKVSQFAAWLRLEAPLAYRGDEHGGANDGLRVPPNAVSLLTVHASKGLEWPVVWLPDLAEGRFPLWAHRSGSKVWDILPLGALSPAQARRADGEDGESDRLAYVACSRSEAYLLATYAPPKGWRNSKPSPYFDVIERHPDAVQDKRVIPAAAKRDARRLEPSPRRESRTIAVTFSQLFTYWQCPRAFYLRFLIGFPPPLVPELGYGESLHRAVKEVHERVRDGEALRDEVLKEIALRHFHLPFASESLNENLSGAAVRALTAYHNCYRKEEDGEVAFIEQEIRLDLGLLTLIGRVDLATVLEDGDIVLAEIKTEKATSSDDELYAYGLGFEAGSGRLPDWVETRSIRADVTASDDSSAPKRKMMDATAAAETRSRIREVGEAIGGGHFPMVKPEDAATKCKRCDVRLVCLRGQSMNMETKELRDAPIAAD